MAARVPLALHRELNRGLLDAADELTGGEATGQQLTRPVRTGTALDNFQIDLGELFAENKK